MIILSDLNPKGWNQFEQHVQKECGFIKNTVMIIMKFILGFMMKKSTASFCMNLVAICSVNLINDMKILMCCL